MERPKPHPSLRIPEHVEAPSTANQITASYYHCLVGQINRGTCSKVVRAVLRQNGSHSYYTYHLLSG